MSSAPARTVVRLAVEDLERRAAPAIFGYGPEGAFRTEAAGGGSGIDGLSAASSRDCIPTWWGLCHAWVPAGIPNAVAGKAVATHLLTVQSQNIDTVLALLR